MARRSGNFLDRVIEGAVFLLGAVYVMGGPLWIAVTAVALGALRIYRIWAAIYRKG